MLKINADVGECGFEVDSLIMPYLDMASVACGGHIGDNNSMTLAVGLAKKYQVTIGAHISYDDKENFGRISQNINNNKLFLILKSQFLSLQKITKLTTQEVTYIKPHGALYHDCCNDINIFTTILNLIKQFIPRGFLLIQANILPSEFINLAKNKKIKLSFEFFADRLYLQNNKLSPRSNKNSVFSKEAEIIQQYNFFQKKYITGSICFHSDNPASVLALQKL